MSVAEQFVAVYRYLGTSYIPNDNHTASDTDTEVDQDRGVFLSRLFEGLAAHRQRQHNHSGPEQALDIQEYITSDSHDQYIFVFELTYVQLMVDYERRRIIEKYESQFGMSSEEFLRRWREGTMPDLFETNEWAILLTY